MCKYKVSWFGKQAQHCGASAASSPAPLSSQAPGVLFCRLASRSTSAKFTLGQLSQMCRPIPLMLCTWNSSLEICNSSPGPRTAKPRAPKLHPSFSPASRRPQPCPSYGGGHLASRKQTKLRHRSTRMRWKQPAAKTGPASCSGRGHGWPASVWPLKAEHTSHAPMSEQGAHSCPSPTVEPALPGAAQQACKSQT